MPATTYMVVDPRRDHSLRIPRPDRSASLGTPNACTGCHRDRDAAWAAAAARRWYGEARAGFQDFAEAFHAAESGAPGAGASLQEIAADVGRPAIVRASALARLARMPGSGTATVARAVAKDPSPLVRLAAAGLAETLPPAERLAVVTPLLADPLRNVRTEAARVLPAVPAGAMTPAQATAWNRATAEYVATLGYTADRPESRVALGTLRASQGRYAEAQAGFAGALALDDRFVPAYLNAADAHRAAGDDDSARKMLEAGLARVPDDAALHHSLGLTLVRQQQAEPALRALARAATLAPDERRYAYVLGVALHSYGRSREAIGTLERAAARWPDDRDILIALVTIQRDTGRMDAARRWAKSLLSSFPGDPEVSALAAEIG
jgi:tetratricopeptide (TPR) repeat protein